MTFSLSKLAPSKQKHIHNRCTEVMLSSTPAIITFATHVFQAMRAESRKAALAQTYIASYHKLGMVCMHGLVWLPHFIWYISLSQRWLTKELCFWVLHLLLTKVVRWCFCYVLSPIPGLLLLYFCWCEEWWSTLLTSY